MKILVDQNISFRILPKIHNSFPDVSHVRDLGLTDFSDFQIFQFARQNRFDVILTLDEDFYNIILEQGIPPKIIWLRTGNCSTTFLAQVINNNAELIQDFMQNDFHDYLEIFS